MSKRKRKANPLAKLSPAEKLLHTTDDELALNRQGKLSEAQREVFSRSDGCAALLMVAALPLVVSLSVMGLAWLSAGLWELVDGLLGNVLAPPVFWLLSMIGMMLLVTPLVLLLGRAVTGIATPLDKFSLRRAHRLEERVLLAHTADRSSFYLVLPERQMQIAIDYAIWRTLHNNGHYALYFARRWTQLVAIEPLAPPAAISPQAHAHLIHERVPRWSSLRKVAQFTLPAAQTVEPLAEKPKRDHSRLTQSGAEHDLREPSLSATEQAPAARRSE